ncbi:hypothetical protein KUCAC02_019327, partial [Chaenocephalus aceratus]
RLSVACQSREGGSLQDYRLTTPRYGKARTAHSMIHKVLTSMMLEAFLSKYPERRTELEALHVNCQSKDLTAEEWYTTKERADTIQAAFQVYLKER